MKKLLFLGVALVLAVSLAGCGGDDDISFGPGLVAIDDSDDLELAPLLTVDYIDPVTLQPATALIFSDPASDGDIAFDQVLGVFAVTTAPFTVFFGIDQADPNVPEFRGFFTFPLDGETLQDIVPSGAAIQFASVTVFVNDVLFFDRIPTFLDLVVYPFRGLGVPDPAVDFDTPVLAFRTLEFLFPEDVLNFVEIEVTSLMARAQEDNLLDFQVRFSVDRGAVSTRSLATKTTDSAKIVKPFSERGRVSTMSRGKRDAGPLPQTMREQRRR
jgi:hypothetical protein